MRRQFSPIAGNRETRGLAIERKHRHCEAETELKLLGLAHDTLGRGEVATGFFKLGTQEWFGGGGHALDRWVVEQISLREIALAPLLGPPMQDDVRDLLLHRHPGQRNDAGKYA
jgi:hypothetical protein